MNSIYEASIVGTKLRVKDKPFDKKKAMSRVRHGEDVYTTKSQAYTLSIRPQRGPRRVEGWTEPGGWLQALPRWVDQFSGHIFYGEPSG